MSHKLHYDLCVVGAGLYGTGISRDAAGRGLSVLLVDAHDIAGATSSATSKVDYGGFLGLERHSFSTSLRSLKEREVSYKSAQHLYHPMTCIMPLDYGDSQEEKVSALWRVKLWVYNRLSEDGLFRNARRCVLNGDDKRLIPLKNPSLEEEDDDTAIMKPHERLRFLGNITDKDYALKLARKVMTFTVCKVDDTRLVICNAIDAALRGAKVLTYTSCDGVQAKDDCWRVSLRDTRGGDTLDITASMVVNATGPWASSFIDRVGVGKNDPDLPKVRLVKESHIILPRQYDGDHAYVLRQGDGSKVFVMPYEGKYTLVGAAREECEEGEDLKNVKISDSKVKFLIDAYNAGFEKAVDQSDVVFSFSAARLVPESCALDSEHTGCNIYHHKRYDVPLVSVYGGQVEHYRLLAEKVVDRLMTLSGRLSGGWTAQEPMKSADFSGKDLAGYISVLKRDYPWLPEKLLQRYVCAYGTQMEKIVQGAHSLSDLGEHYGDGVYEAEFNYLKENEWVFDSEDTLWRRSKLALHISEETERNIQAAFLPEGEVAQEEEALCA